MPTPFPGMDPYLEHPALWPDVHNSLVAALREDLSSRLAPRYYVGLERRVCRVSPDDLVFIGRPDLSVVALRERPRPAEATADLAVLEVDVPLADEVEETFLEVRDGATGAVVTVFELLSPVNKSGAGRGEYLRKREQILRSRTSLVEVDLLRAGLPMPVVQQSLPPSPYRILVSPGATRPRATLLLFGLRQPIPSFGLPLAEGDEEPSVDLGRVLHDLYDRVHFELLVDYSGPCTPPLGDDDREWARSLGVGE